MIKKVLLPPPKYKVLKHIFTLRTDALRMALTKIMHEYYDQSKIHTAMDYLYVEGDIPVLLVAHLDTVHPAPPKTWVHDNESHIIWSPDGLGADDRAGVFSILEILQTGYRPYVLFTTGEEVGGVGARTFVTDYPDAPKDLLFIIELDRQGEKDAVYYSCGNEEFGIFIESFGFELAWGTFSDISTIAPVWDIAAVNLSIGYFNEHTLVEHLNYNFMFETIRKVEKILDNCGDKVYKFERWISPYPSETWYVTPREMEGKIQCDSCNQFFPADQMISARDRYEKDIWRLCPSCYKLNQDIVEAIV